MPKQIPIELVYALPDRQTLLSFEVEEGTTLEQAILLSDVQDHHPELDLSTVKFGIFGKITPKTHGLEGDFNRKGTSAFSGRIGEQVAAKGVTIVDDGTIAERRGSLTIDDEGTPTQCTTLIEDGILKGYMQDKMNARLMGQESTGNGRRESYDCLPMPRMG